MVDVLEGQSLIDALLGDQQLRAVARFAPSHEHDEAFLHVGWYRDEIPLSIPQVGEHYALRSI